MNQLLRRLEVSDVARTVNAATMQRARGLVRHVHVTRPAPQEGPATVLAAVQGTHEYQTMVQVKESGSGLSIIGNCSCPVTYDCKHAMAVCLLIIEQRITEEALAEAGALPAAPVPGSVAGTRPDEAVPGPDAAGQASELPLGVVPVEGEDPIADALDAWMIERGIKPLRGSAMWRSLYAARAKEARSAQLGATEALSMLDARPVASEPVWTLRQGAGPVELPGVGRSAPERSSQPSVGQPVTRRETWAQDLDTLLYEIDGLGRTQPGNTLALQFTLDLVLPRYGGSYPVTARAMTLGKKGRWIKTGAGWNDIVSGSSRVNLDEEQRAAMEGVAQALSRGYRGGRGEDERGLEDATIGFWGSLQRSVDAGAELLAAGDLESVELAPDRARLVVDVRDLPSEPVARAAHTGERDGATAHTPEAAVREPSGRSAVSLGVHWDGGTHVGASVVPIGRRVHGVLLLLPGATEHTRRGVLVRLDRVLTEALSYHLRGTRRTLVPTEGRERLVGEVLPRLARSVEVRSDDPTLRAGIPEKPTLLTRITWQAADAALVEFLFRYRAGEREELVPARRRAPGETEPPGSLPRDRSAEDHAIEAWDPGAATREVVAFDGTWPLDAQRITGAPVVRFVSEVLAQLRAAGEVVEIGVAPTLTPLQGDPQIRFEIGEEPSGGVDWLDLSITVSVDGESIPLAELLAALTAQDPVILLPSGSYVDATHPALTQLGRMVEEAQGVRRGGAPAAANGRREDSVRIASGDVALWEIVDKLGETDDAAARWVQTARALRAPERMPTVEPHGVLTELRDYQREGLNWLHYLYSQGLGGILADDMGLGKTLQVLSLVSLARQGGAAPFLVVAPTSVVGAWQRQGVTHTPHLTVRTIANTIRRRKTTLEEVVDGADIVVTSYTLLRSEAEDYAAIEWGGLVLDEAQAIKNAASKTFQAARTIRAPFALAVTGTPVENRIGELWPQLAVVAPGLYPTLESFTRLVTIPVERDGDQKAMDRLRRRIRPFLLRRTKALVASALPPKQEEVLPVSLGSKHRHFYDALLQRERQEVLGLVENLDEHRVAVLASITRLRRGSLHAGLVDEEHAGTESAKIAELIPRLVELAQEGHRALVFSQFTSFLALIREAVTAAGLDSVYLDGSTRDRAQVLADFADGDAPVFLISLKAGGVGLTLTEADYVFIMDPWWNPAVEAQAVDRAHRIGQERPVMVYRMVAEGTIEEKVMTLKERKAEIFEQVIGSAQASPSALSEDDLRELFAG